MMYLTGLGIVSVSLGFMFHSIPLGFLVFGVGTTAAAVLMYLQNGH